MKKTFTFLLMALMALAGFKSWGQTDVEIGTGTYSSANAPFHCFYNYSYAQMLYWGSEIGTSGTINSISFNNNTNGTSTVNLNIYMKCVDRDSYSNKSDWESVTNGNLVCSTGVVSFGKGWVTFTLDTPFQYDSSKNLMIAVDNNTGNYSSSYAMFKYTSTSPKYTCIYQYSDGTNVDPMNPSAGNSYTAERPNIIINITESGSCPKPKDLAVSNITTTGATISWTGSAESYDLAYGFASTFNLSTPDTYTLRSGLTATSVTLSGLIAETEYKCAVKAHCSAEDESDWSNAVSFTPSNKKTLTVNDGTDVYDKAPFYGDNAYYYLTKSQFVIPASYIEDMQGCEITQFKFYVNSSSSYNSNYSSHTWDVYIKEMDDPSGAWWDFYDFGTMTKVYSGSVSIVNNELTVTFDEPFQYSNKSLMIGFNQTQTGFYGVTHWLGSNNTTGSAGTNRCRAGWQNGSQKETKPFLPKTTFTYTSGASCPKPKDLAVSNITATGATISWTGSAESYNLDVNGTVYKNVTSPYILDVELSTTYTVKVQAVCDEDETSAWSSAINFTTPDCWDGHTINYTLNDSYGDGWNGAYLTIVDSDDNTIETLTLSNGTESGSLTLCSGTYDFVWHTGSYDSECSFSISENGETLFTCGNASVYANGQVVYTLDLLEKFSIILIHPSEEVGTISADYEQAPAGTTVTLSANPAFGYEFGTWTVMAGEDPVPVPVTNNTFEMPESDVTVTATFNELTPYNINCAELTEGTIHAEYNGVTISEAPAGTEITLVAEANAGYTLDHFTVDDEPLPGNTFIMPESNVTVSAVFSPVYNISIDMALVGGSISQMSAQGTLTAYPAGTQVFLFANPDEDYSFVENSFIVIRSDGEIGPTVTYTNMVYSFIMPESNVTVSATFNKTAFAVSQVITPTYSGSFSVSKTAHVGIGETVTLSNFNAYEGYYFDFEDVNSLVVKRNDNQETVEVSNYGNIYQFAMPTSDVTVTATFKDLPRYSVFVGDVVNGTITLDNPYQDIFAGAIVYFEVEPETGYTLESITVTPEEGNPFEPTQQSWYYYFTMPSSNVTISATFRQLQSYTINYYVNGQLDRTMQCQETHFVNNDGPQNVAVPAGMTFEGWGIAEIDTYTTEKPVVLGNAEKPTQNYDLYAVLSYTESVPASSKSGETWKKVTSTSELSAGDEIVLVYSNLVMCTRENAYWEDYPVADVTISNGEITNLPENAAQFTLIANNGYWNLQYNELGATRILATNSYNNELAPKDLYESWYPTYMSIDFTATTNSNSVLFYNSDTYMYIRYRSDWSQITTSNGSSTTYACQAYKLDNPVITNTYYMTSVLADGEVTENTTAKNIIITTETVTVDNNIVLTMNENGLFRNKDAAKFVFEDGAELIYTGEETVNATFEKDIIGYNSKGSDGWYFIANPTANTTVNLSGGNSYDLYTFNPAAAAEWHNEQYENNVPIPENEIAISRETGYLYANSQDFTLRFAGELIPSGEEIINLVYAEEGSGIDFPGFNLIGNPFPCTAYISGEFSIFKLINGSEVQIREDGTVDPCEAFFVEATEVGETVTLSTTAPEGKSRIMPIVVNSDRGETLDRAILHLEGTRNSHKFMMNPDRTNISFAKNGERFASVSRGDETEIPMNFTADHKGSYTISFNTENFEEGYLHLIDVVSGDNIDLLVTPSYTFEADADEYASRFRIVFGTTDINDDPATSSEPFVYISNGNLVINNVEGTASMQIVDMLGRIVRTETVSGSYNKPHNLKAGAYVITLDGKAQRIVIE